MKNITQGSWLIGCQVEPVSWHRPQLLQMDQELLYDIFKLERGIFSH